MNSTTVYTDILVIGSGIAGLRSAVAAAEKGVSAIIVSKGPCASPEIMGFNAPVLPGDSVQQYFDDLEVSGYGINNSRLAKVLSERVLPEVDWLESIGVDFDRREDGCYSAIHVLGTKYPRLIRSGVSSGVTEMNALRRKCEELNIETHMPVDILELLYTDDRVIGAYGVDGKTGALVRYIAKAVILATGGCGAIQSFTTYPDAIIGDGYAMAYQCGASLTDMEFQQFEPCCFVYPPEIKGKVIATTLLRHGAQLLNGQGHDFMADYGLTRENSQKGSLSRAMVAEVRSGRGTPHGGIYYNLTMFDEDFLYKDHAIFTRPAVAAGMDLTKQMPEMMPAAHTNLGGVVIDEGCRTELPGLYACGEVIGGLHGGNRLGGCAGAETVIFGHLAGESAAEYVKADTRSPSAAEVDEAWTAHKAKLDKLFASEKSCDAKDIRVRLGQCLSNNMGILRNEQSIKAADDMVEQLKLELTRGAGAADAKQAAECIHAEHVLLIAKMQIKASMLRKESRGVYFREDYPYIDDKNWCKNIMIKKTDGKMEFSILDAVKVH